MYNKNAKKKISYVFIVLEVIAVLFLSLGIMEYWTQIATFRTGEKFVKIEAKCVKSKFYSKSGNSSLYNNMYEYEVDGHTYQYSIYGEKKKGEDRVLYYNPSYPMTASVYGNVWIALFFNSLKLFIGIVFQVVAIMYYKKRKE